MEVALISNSLSVEKLLAFSLQSYCQTVNPYISAQAAEGHIGPAALGRPWLGAGGMGGTFVTCYSPGA